MITVVSGSIFAVAPTADAIVNPVNCVGVMGKGLALEYKNRFLLNYMAYRAHCDAGMMKPGQLFCFEQLGAPKWIVNFATKDHWRDPSKMDWIASGLSQLREWLVVNDVHSIAIPALGVGLGGLPWDAVKRQVEFSLKDVKTEILLFEPR